MRLKITAVKKGEMGEYVVYDGEVEKSFIPSVGDELSIPYGGGFIVGEVGERSVRYFSNEIDVVLILLP